MKNVDENGRNGRIKIPMTFVREEESCVIRKIGGKEETGKFLESLGLIIGCEVTLVSRSDDGVIVNVLDSRLALSREMAEAILVEPLGGE
jgi:ferrous iron transport protein A